MSDGADLPYFKFFVADWLSDLNVRAMDPATRGIYADLLAFDWREDGIPNDPEFLARALGVDAERMRAACETLSDRFIPHPEKDGHVTNKRLSKERNEIREDAEKRSEAARKAAKARWEQEKSAGSDADDADRSADEVPSQGDTRSREMSESESEPEEENNSDDSESARETEPAPDVRGFDRLTDWLGEHDDAAYAFAEDVTARGSWANSIIGQFHPGEGTLGHLLKPIDEDRRPAMLATALMRYAGEEEEYDNRLFRGYLERVIHEEKDGADHHRNGSKDRSESTGQQRERRDFSAAGSS